MNAQQLSDSAREASHPPDHIPDTLRALWFVRAGRWHEAHDLCQYIPDPDGAWIHAHLHRIVGDEENSAYWYYRAGHPIPELSLDIDREWLDLASHFTARQTAL